MSRSLAVALLSMAIFAAMVAAAAEPTAHAAYPPIVVAGATGSTIVEKGDHLWSIAEEALAAHLGRDPSIAETSAYWRQTISANVGRIRSGNPDLIYPGEEIVLPNR